MPSNRRLWTKRDYDFLRDNYCGMSASKMAAVLCRTPAAVRCRLSLWGILLEYRRVEGTNYGVPVAVETNPSVRDTLPD